MRFYQRRVQNADKLCWRLVRLGISRAAQFGPETGKAQDDGDCQTQDPAANQVPIRMKQPGNELVAAHELLRRRKFFPSTTLLIFLHDGFNGSEPLRHREAGIYKFQLDTAQPKTKGTID